MKTANSELVTGASSGIGLGITRALLERDYRVVGNSRAISQSKRGVATGQAARFPGQRNSLIGERMMPGMDFARKNSNAKRQRGQRRKENANPVSVF